MLFVIAIICVLYMRACIERLTRFFGFSMQVAKKSQVISYIQLFLYPEMTFSRSDKDAQVTEFNRFLVRRLSKLFIKNKVCNCISAAGKLSPHKYHIIIFQFSRDEFFFLNIHMWGSLKYIFEKKKTT